MEFFKEYPQLIAVLSERKNGSMGSFVKGANNAEENNRSNFLNELELEMKSTVRAGMVHGGNAKNVFPKDGGKIILETDGLVTNTKNLFLAISAADCLPVFLFDPGREVVGLAHAGWKGLAERIIEATINKMKELGADSENIIVEVGPGIGVCHYTIKDDVKNEMLEKFKQCQNDEILQERDDKVFIDLKKIAKMQLIDAGIKKENINISDECTYCLCEKYFSHRKNPESGERMIAIIGMKN